MAPGAQCVATLQGHTGWIDCVTLLPDGRFVSGSSDGTLKIWDPSKEPGAQCVATLQGHTEWINCVTLLPDGRFVSGSDDNTLKIWNPSRRNREHNVSLPCGGTLTGYAASLLLPDGRFVSGSNDRTLKIWDPSMAPGAQCVATLQGHTDWIRCVTLLPDGRFVSGSFDKTLKIWDPSKEPAAQCVATLRGHTDRIRCVTLLPMADSSPAPDDRNPENLGPKQGTGSTMCRYPAGTHCRDRLRHPAPRWPIRLRLLQLR